MGIRDTHKKNVMSMCASPEGAHDYAPQCARLMACVEWECLRGRSGGGGADPSRPKDEAEKDIKSENGLFDREWSQTNTDKTKTNLAQISLTPSP